MSFKLLDCTLRDGGYYTNWDFPDQVVTRYLEAFNNLPVEYLEIGYRTTPQKDYVGEYFYCPEYLLKEISERSNKKLAVILNEKDVSAQQAKSVLGPCHNYIDLVRIAINPASFDRALKLGEAVKNLGYEVSFNVMYMSNWQSHKEFQALIPEVKGMVKYLYMVDSFGGVYPEDVKQTIELIKDKVSVPIGFHGHNNLELGLINTLTAMEHGAEIVDATITGMGRGAGNLKTELLLSSLNAKKGLEVDFNALSKVVNDFEELQKKYEWGTNLPYMVSGANSFPQKDVMEWVSKRYYSYNSITRTIQNKKNDLPDNKKLSVLNNKKHYKKAVVIGGGPGAAEHARAIKAYLRLQTDICVIHASSRNAEYFKDVEVDQYFCLIGSEGHRLEQILPGSDDFSALCVLPPYPRDMGTYIPPHFENRSYEIPKFQHDSFPENSPTALALETAKFFDVADIFAAGYDGYSDALMGEKEQALFAENNEIFKTFTNDSINLVSITPTKYDELPVVSVYSLLTTGDIEDQ